MKTSRRERWKSRWEEGLGYHVLMAALLLGLGLGVLVDQLDWSIVVLHGAYLLIFLDALSVAARTRAQLLVGGLLALPELVNWLFCGTHSVFRLLPAIESSTLVTVVVGVFTTVFLFYLVTLTVISVFRRTTITWSQVSAAASAYLLLGYAWRGIYVYLDRVEDPAETFGGLSEGNHEAALIYYSFVTLTTLGYGDVVPVSQAARLFSILEAIIGQLFLVILLARLVGMVRDDRKASTDPG